MRRVVSDVHCGLNELCKKHRTKKAVIDERTLQRHLGIVPFAKHSLHHCLHSTTTSTYCHGKLTTPTPPLAALKQATQENGAGYCEAKGFTRPSVVDFLFPHLPLFLAFLFPLIGASLGCQH